jgi:ABC-2 type transport system permease protein
MTMNGDDTPTNSFSTVRRVGIGLNVVVSILAFLAVVLMLNYLSARHFRRLHWISDARYQLSPQTRDLLGAITNSIQVTILFDRTEPLFSSVSGLLKEYAYVCPHLKVEHVDYRRDLNRAQLVVTKYQLPQKESDLVIFEMGARRTMVRASELSDYDWTGLMRGEKEVKRLAFKGERLFSAAILSLVDNRQPVACLLQGHGEHDPSSDEGTYGYSELVRLLGQKNIQVRLLRLNGTNQMPEDCQMLIIAGPQHAIAPEEVEKISNYLNGGGRLLAMLSFYRSMNAAGNDPRKAQSGLEKLLTGWGLAIGNDYTSDPGNTRSGSDLVCTNFVPHSITHALMGSSVYLPAARSVIPIQGNASASDGAKAQALLLTSEKGVTTSEIRSDGVASFNPLRDRRGAISVAAAVEKGSIAGVSADRGSSRIVVVGDSFVFGNAGIMSDANLSFANQTINWLLDRPKHLSGIAPQPLQERRVSITQNQMFRLRLLLAVVFPGAVIFLGILVWFRRRR